MTKRKYDVEADCHFKRIISDGEEVIIGIQIDRQAMPLSQFDKFLVSAKLKATVILDASDPGIPGQGKLVETSTAEIDLEGASTGNGGIRKKKKGYSVQLTAPVSEKEWRQLSKYSGKNGRICATKIGEVGNEADGDDEDSDEGGGEEAAE